ncbi:MAG: arsenate reductase ArsC [Candidatus Krumholzibacteriia bacterium]
MTRVLFVCMANSCRSQMAEAWARHLFPDGWQAESAGLLTYPISRRTRAVMAEVGLSLDGHEPRSIDGLDLDRYDLVVTLSREVGKYLPRLAHPERHWRRPIADPMSAEGTPDEVRAAFRNGRDRTRAIVEEVVAALSARPGERP